MQQGDTVILTGWSTEDDGEATVEDVQPSATTQEWVYLRFPDGREGYYPASYVIPG